MNGVGPSTLRARRLNQHLEIGGSRIRYFAERTARESGPVPQEPLASPVRVFVA